MDLTNIILFIISVGIYAVLSSYFAATVMRDEHLTKADGRRSECDHCGKQLSWWQLVPIFSYPLLRGKCSHCHKPIDIKIWLSELLGVVTAIPVFVYLDRLFALSPFTSWINVLGAAMFILSAAVLLYLAISDMFTYTIMTKVTVGLVLALVLLNGIMLLLTPRFPELAQLGLGTPQNLIAAIVYGGGIYAIIKLTGQRGMGMGDLYLAVATGLYLGWPRTLAAFYITITSAMLAGVLMAIKAKKWRGLQVPFVPFFLIGFVYAAVFGFELFDLLFPGLRLWMNI